MNFEVWRDELQIFDQDSCLEDDDEPIMHLWQTKKDNVVFMIKDGYKLVEEIFEGKKYYTVEKDEKVLDGLPQALQVQR